MATWGEQTSPVVKFEASPAESFISTGDEMYPSLFRDSTPSSTLNPLDIMTPRSDPDGKNGDATLHLSTLAELADDSATSAANPERKPTKKRKSWGQVLPEPKTNLPPR
jgi:transcriptional activator HAC1